MEIAITNTTRSGRDAIGRALDRFRSRPFDWLLWVLACIPLLCVPPAAAIALVLLRSRNGGPRNEWILLVAVLNIAISLLIWSSIASQLGDFRHALEAFISMFLMPGEASAYLPV